MKQQQLGSLGRGLLRAAQPRHPAASERDPEPILLLKPQEQLMSFLK